MAEEAFWNRENYLGRGGIVLSGSDHVIFIEPRGYRLDWLPPLSLLQIYTPTANIKKNCRLERVLKRINVDIIRRGGIAYISFAGTVRMMRHYNVIDLAEGKINPFNDGGYLMISADIIKSAVEYIIKNNKNRDMRRALMFFLTSIDGAEKIHVIAAPARGKLQKVCMLSTDGGDVKVWWMETPPIWAAAALQKKCYKMLFYCDAPKPIKIVEWPSAVMYAARQLKRCGVNIDGLPGELRGIFYVAAALA
ncbi:MAG: hypothetical protein QXX99_05100 [Candidatus Bathyarchaeia archaeon]